MGREFLDPRHGAMTAMEKRHSDSTSELWSLLGAIVSGERARAIQLLEAAPRLAVETAHVGATRETADAHFLDAIEHYVYAGDTALHIAAAAYAPDVARELIRWAPVRAPGTAWARSRCTTPRLAILAPGIGIQSRKPRSSTC